MKKGLKNIISVFAAILLLPGFMWGQEIVCASQTGAGGTNGADNNGADHDAAEIQWKNYGQTIFNTTEGLSSNNVSSIAQTSDGIVWIGTDEGLVAYDGNEFIEYGSFFHFDGVNDMAKTADGGVWFATTTYGGAIYLGSRFQHFDDVSETVSNYATCITEGKDGFIYIGTLKNMLVIDPAEGFTCKEPDGDEFFYINAFAAGEKLTAAATINGSLVFLRDGEKTAALEDVYTGEASLGYADGYFLVGTSDGSIIAVDENNIGAGEAFRIKAPVKSITGEGSRINNFFYEAGKRLWVLCEDGIGYYTLENGGLAALGNAEFTQCSFDNFESGFGDMMMDYQGNYWISSSKRGVLLLRQSRFTDEFAQLGLDADVVNAVLISDKVLYAATDSGILAVDTLKKQPVTDKFTGFFDGKRVSDIVLYENKKYAAVYGEGVYDENGELVITAGRINRIRIMDGSMYVLTDEGCTVWNESGLRLSFDKEDGLYNTRLSAAIVGAFGKQKKEKLYLASQGAGIYVLSEGRLEDCIDENSGLPSKHINDLAACGEGFFAATDKGIAYYNGKKITELKNMPEALKEQKCEYIFIRDGRLYAACRNALFVMELEKLFDSGEGGESEYELYDGKAGFFGTLTEGGHGFMDDGGRIYLSCGRKIYSFVDDEQDFDIASLKIMLQSVKVDKRSAEIIDKGDNEYEVNLTKDAKEIDILCSVLNFSNEDPYVRYILPGVDKKYTTMRLSGLEHIKYKELAGGSHSFYFELLGDERDEKGNPIAVSSIVLRINKEKALFERLWVRMALLGAGFGVLMYFVFKDRKKEYRG